MRGWRRLVAAAGAWEMGVDDGVAWRGGVRGALRAVVVAGLCFAGDAFAAVPQSDDAAPPVTLERVVVTATGRAAAVFDVPASITPVVIDPVVAARAGITTAEFLRLVPGVVARDRNNRAQDEQISIRGFGARASFGVRGVRLVSDGIPATMPDGQGQLSHFDLDAASHLEVLRGPFSALYGNAAGGVIAFFSARGEGAPVWQATSGFGSDESWRSSIGGRGELGGIGFNVDAGRDASAGARRHARARRDRGNARFDVDLAAAGELMLVFNAVSIPEALDPKGLSREEFRFDPRAAADAALVFNTRKSVAQNQAGARHTLALGDNQSLRTMAHAGKREVLQYLSIPIAAQRAPTSGGGVVDLATRYGGVDLRWSWEGAAWRVDLGAAANGERQHRKGFENFIGTTLGVTGSLRRDQIDSVRDRDFYAQIEWRHARGRAFVGLRESAVRFRSEDRYIAPGNPDDSGAMVYRAASPVAGLVHELGAGLHLHAALGRGLATPTLSERAYRPDGGAGLHHELVPAHSVHGELGLKWRRAGAALDLAVFRADTRDDLAVAGSSGGRSTYRNIGRSRRQGVELALDLALAENWQLRAALTRIDARFGKPCPGQECAISAGARIPGIPGALGSADLAWQRGAWRVALEADVASGVRADDAGHIVAPGYATLGASASARLTRGGWTFEPHGRIDNLFDKAHVGSVIVNQSSGGSLEPAAGRSFWLGLRIGHTVQ